MNKIHSIQKVNWVSLQNGLKFCIYINFNFKNFEIANMKGLQKVTLIIIFLKISRLFAQFPIPFNPNATLKTITASDKEYIVNRLNFERCTLGACNMSVLVSIKIYFFCTKGTILKTRFGTSLWLMLRKKVLSCAPAMYKYTFLPILMIIWFTLRK